ncbi:phosphodiester glycosidase family protein [Acididesulfobacillus acetoxydans]|uniref:phosphodiester glycosidase family protein n=1 Tax=Acididesulfobacillus acetoxydans TaxID=1561005 RepID=UPI001F113219|nr:phosphodiester glycosidase family protein [Acididesulfobacillus acetoxydans]
MENTWYQSKDTFTSLLYSVNSGAERPGLTNAGKAQAGGSSKPASTGPVSSPPLEKSITFPDPSRPYVKVSLVKINPALVNFHLVAGTKDPVSVTGIHGSGRIPLSVQRQGNVIAAFNAGFQSRDGIYGFMAEQRVYQSPAAGLATFCIYGNGKVDIGSWGNEIKSDAGIVSLRQNLHLLIDNGRLNPLINDQAKWGTTVNNAVRVWRSGIGIDKQGRIIYAAGDSLTAETLARALLSAGCVRAMELDINSYWVTFNFFRRTAGKQGATLEGTKLDPSMRRSAARYLTPDTRDFFYLTLKPLNAQTTP